MKDNKHFVASFYIFSFVIVYSFGWSLYSLIKNYTIFRDSYILSSAISRLLISIIPIVGIVISIKSKFENLTITRTYACFTLILAPITYIGLFYTYFGNSQYQFPFKDQTLLQKIQIIFGNIIALILPIVSAIIITESNKKRRIVTFVYYSSIETITTFSSANKWRRFVNRVVDVVTIFSIAATALNMLQLASYSLDNVVFAILAVLASIYFYVILEMYFHTTVGKSLTNTTIVDEYGNYPSFGQILTRTICRFIPFEGFSFLNEEGRGWHDTISNTYVVKTELKDSAKDFEFEFEHKQEY